MDYKVCNLDVWSRLEEELVPFMIARVPVFGGGEYIACKLNGSLPRAGKYMYGDTLRYVISPRAAFIKRVSSNDTVDARGILNQRDDPHADPTKYWRLHDINWEAIRSPFQVYLRDCIEVLVMTAYEKGYLKNPPKIADPVSAIRQITLDIEECNWKLDLENGSKIDAIQELMIGHYLAGIERMLDNEETTDRDRYAFKLLEATLEVFDTRRLEYFINGIDWVTKKALIDEFAKRDSEIGLALCNQFTALDEVVLEYIGEKPETSSPYTTFSLKDSLEFAEDAIPWENWADFTKLIKHGLLNGPDGSRDYIRCLAVKEFQGLLRSIEWESINFHNASIRLDEPFIFNKEMCGDILEKSTNTFNEFSVALDKLNQEKQHVLYAPSEDHEKHDMEEG
jgi:proteasome accessory factor A